MIIKCSCRNGKQQKIVVLAMFPYRQLNFAPKGVAKQLFSMFMVKKCVLCRGARNTTNNQQAVMYTNKHLLCSQMFQYNSFKVLKTSHKQTLTKMLSTVYIHYV